MKTTAAMLTGVGKPFEIVELDLAPPREREVLIRYAASGLCLTDLHMRNGDTVVRFPMVGGHEGAGVIEAVGPGVSAVAPGDHVVCSFMPTCGTCRECAKGSPNRCTMGSTRLKGCMPDGSFRLSRAGEDVGAMCLLGTFSQYGVVPEQSVVKVDESIPLDVAVLLGCGVLTGWGSSVYSAKVHPGDTTIVYGAGGIGLSAVQGAAHAGATNVIAVDPLEFKRDSALKLGATHAVATAGEARQLALEITGGAGADQAVVCVSVADEAVITDAFTAVGKGGIVVLTAVNHPEAKNVHLPGYLFTVHEKTVTGSVLGSCSPQRDIPLLLRMYRSGHLKLEQMVSTRYRLDQINEGYRDLLDGRNIRGVIVQES